MIQLEIANYCHECRAFDPVVVNEPNGDMSVICKNHKNCSRLVRYLAKQIEKNAQNESTDRVPNLIQDFHRCYGG